MPISCPINIRPLSEDEFQALDYRVMGHAFASQNELGRLCDETAYQRDLQARLLSDGFATVNIEVPVSVSHQSFSKCYSLDMVADSAVYEFKIASAINTTHQAQLLNYLFLLDVPRGKLLSFRPAKVEGRVHATSLDAQQRHQFRFDCDRWVDQSENCGILRRTLRDLLNEWGAFLDFELYQQALTHFCGGELQVIQRLPIHRGSISLGTQRFRIHSPAVAFRVTAVTDQLDAIESNLRRLLRLSDLHAMQWINLNRHTIQLVTILK